MDGNNVDKSKKEKKCWSLHKPNWENYLVNSIGKGPFTGPNKALVNTLQDVCQIGGSQYRKPSVIALKQNDAACLVLRKYVSEGNQFCFP